MVSLLALQVPGVHHLPTAVPMLSTDALITAVTLLVIAYGMIGGYVALVREAISIYVGLALATSLGQAVYHQTAAVHLPVNQTGARLFLLLVPIILLQFGRKHHHGRHEHKAKHHLIFTLILAVFAAMLLVSSALAQLEPVTLASATTSSQLASWIYDFRLVWLAGVPIVVAVTAIFKPKSHH